MINVLFVCHGNICRSPMAEFICKDMLRKNGLADQVHVESAATSDEEIGEDIHWGAREILATYGIPYERRHARRITREDAETFDYLIAMDKRNIRNMRYTVGPDGLSKASLMMDWAGSFRDVADPWYTGDFQTAYHDINAGCLAFVEHLKRSLEV